MFQDYMFYGEDDKGQYSFRLLHTSHVANYAKSLHNLSIPRSLLLSEALVGGLLFSSVLEDEESINLRIHCEADFTIGVESTYKGEIRGYIECDEESPFILELDKGHKMALDLQIRTLRTQRNNTALSQGTTSYHGTSMSEAINDHLFKSFLSSAVIKTACWYDKEKSKIISYGIMFQALPSSTGDNFNKINEILSDIKDLKSIILENDDPDFLVKKLVPDAFRGVKSTTPKFVCECSLEKVERVLSTLPKEELLDILEKGEDVDVKCHYCSKNHKVLNDRVREIYTSILPQAYGKH